MSWEEYAQLASTYCAQVGKSRLVSPRQRYITTTFCYGCYLGPTQTARSIASVDHRHVAYVNQYHLTEQKLLDAIVSVINRYNRFELIKWWGSGKRVAADGTNWFGLDASRRTRYEGRAGNHDHRYYARR